MWLLLLSVRRGDPKQCNSIIYTNFAHLSANSLQKRSGGGNNGRSLDSALLYYVHVSPQSSVFGPRWAFTRLLSINAREGNVEWGRRFWGRTTSNCETIQCTRLIIRLV